MSHSTRHIVLLICVLCIANADAQHAQQEAANQKLQPSIGVFGGANLNRYNAEFLALPGIPSCSPTFRQGNGIAPSFGFSFSYPVNPAFDLAIALGYEDLSGSLESLERSYVNVGDNAVPSLIEHNIDATIGSIMLSPSLTYALFERVSVGVGMSLGFVIKADFEQQERLLEPEEVVFDNLTKSNNFQSGNIPNASSFYASLNVGAGYRFPLNTAGTLHAVPEVRYGLALTNVIENVSWKTDRLYSGVSVVYTFPDHTEPVKAPPPPPPPLPPPIIASITAVGLSHDAVESPTASVVVDEYYGKTMSPILPYIFFDSTSLALPDRLRKLAPKEVQAYTIQKIASSNALKTYTEILNILGQRLAANKEAPVVLTGIAHTPESLSMASERAEVVKEYLVHTWGLRPESMVVRTQLSSNTLSEDPDIIDEDERVEIQSNLPSLMDPVVAFDTIRKPNPPSIRMRPTVSDPLQVESWSIGCWQDGKILHGFSGIDTLPQTIDWKIDEASMPKYPGDLNIALTVTDRSDRMAHDTLQLTIDKLTLSKKRTLQIAGNEIEKYSLIVFDLASATLSEQHLRLIADIKRSIKQTSKVQIVGYTDRVGEDDFNRQLSERRAAVVAKALGVAESEIRGVGSSELLYDNNLPEGRFFSRTVVVIIESPEEMRQ